MNNADMDGADRRPGIVKKADDTLLESAGDLDFFRELPQKSHAISFAAGIPVLAADVAANADRPEVVQSVFAAGLAAAVGKRLVAATQNRIRNQLLDGGVG